MSEKRPVHIHSSFRITHTTRHALARHERSERGDGQGLGGWAAEQVRLGAGCVTSAWMAPGRRAMHMAVVPAKRARLDRARSTGTQRAPSLPP